MVEKYPKEIISRTSDCEWIRVGEVWFKVARDKKHLFSSIDDQTRYFHAYDFVAKL